MATWKAEIKVTNNGSLFPVTVEAGSSGTATETIKHIYNPILIRNLHQIRQNSNTSSSSDGDVSLTGTAYLIGIAFLLWIFATFTPLVIMGFSGAFGTWIAEKVTGQSLMEYAERDDDTGHGKALIVFAVALIVGGFGFVKGVEIQKGFNAPADLPAKVQKSN